MITVYDLTQWPILDVLTVLQQETPGEGREEVEGSPRWAEPPVRRKPSVAKMTFSGMAYVVAVSTYVSV